jgi:hypothetical protein
MSQEAEMRSLALTLLRTGFPDHLVIPTVLVLYPFDDQSDPPQPLARQVKRLAKHVLADLNIALQTGKHGGWESYLIQTFDRYIELAATSMNTIHAVRWAAIRESILLSIVGLNDPGALYTRNEAAAILGISNTSTVEEAKHAYRQLAKLLHPDVQASGASSAVTNSAFTRIADAYRAFETNSFKAPAVVDQVPIRAPRVNSNGIPRELRKYIAQGVHLTSGEWYPALIKSLGAVGARAAVLATIKSRLYVILGLMTLGAFSGPFLPYVFIMVAAYRAWRLHYDFGKAAFESRGMWLAISLVCAWALFITTSVLL